MQTKNEKLHENQINVQILENEQTENYELINENSQLKNENVKFTENIEKLRRKSIRNEINSDAKIKYLECHIEKLNVENKKFLERLRMVGKIFNEASDFNIETKNLIEKVNTALGRSLPKPDNANISFASEIKKEIKNEIQNEIKNEIKMEVDDSKINQAPKKHTMIRFDY